MFLKFIILFFLVLTTTLTINYKIMTIVKYIKDGEQETKGSYLMSLVVMFLMIISITLYFTLY